MSRLRYFQPKASRRVGALLAAGGMAATLAACGSSPSHAASTSPSHAASTTSSKAPITWWVPSPSPVPGTLHAAATAFTKKTGIRVNIVATPWSSYLTKLTTAITSGQGPDVAEIGNTWSATFARTGGFIPWTASMYKAIGGKSKFVKTSMGVTGVPGKPAISVPFLGQTWVMLYNKGLFKAAGITAPPRTWSQFYVDAKKLTDPAKGVYGVANAIGSSSAMETWLWILDRQYGGHLYTPQGKPDITSSIDVKVTKQMVEWLYPDGIINPANVADSTGTLDLTEFEHGTAAMLFNQSPEVAVTPPGGYALSYVPLPSPTPPGGAKIMSHVAGENLAIFKNTKHLSEDLEFIKFLTSPSEQETINKAMYELPVTTAGLKTPYFLSPTEKTFGKILSTYARPMPTEASSADLELDYADAFIGLERKDISSHGITTSEVRSALASAQATVEAAG
jgi:multiple sugar transport system substrate-binding protein